MPLKKLKSIGKKILGGAGKAVKKIVPKEVAGIMQVAAPFVAASNPMAALALTTAGQYKSRGRINPLQTILSLAPSPGARGFMKGEIAPFGIENLRLTGRAADLGSGLDKFLYGLGGEKDPTQGILGFGGEFGLKEFTQGKLLSPTLDKTTGLPKLSKSRLAALAASGASLATASKQIEEEAVEAGASDSELDALKAEAADFWSTLSSSDFAVTPTLAQGGRVGFAEGTDKNIPNDPKSRDIASLAKLKDFVNPSNYFMNPRETDDFQTMQKERFMYDYKPKMPSKMLDKIRKLLDKDDKLEAGPSWFFKRVENLEYLGYSPEEAEIIAADDNAYFEIVGYPLAQGGRVGFALGTRPTVQESGLGGLPIEADMRYSGGFMPYGAKEKADDAAGGGSVQKGAQKMYNTMKQLEAMGRA
jgi:hypothetical protein